MHVKKSTDVIVESVELTSKYLERIVKVDFYIPANIENSSEISLLLINDGQDLMTMEFERIIGHLIGEEMISPVLCVGIHCGEDRRNEYGIAASVDYKGRGAKAGRYQKFIFTELLPYIYSHFKIHSFKEKSFAGFSLGALSALDIVWNNPGVFSKVGIFSGSLWWRIKDKNDKEYRDSNDRLMHNQVREGDHQPGLQFFFQVGEHDESEDRNNNGVIDSIDDTIDMMRELLKKGYKEGKDFKYLQLADGRHDVPTWARSFPAFLKWGWKKQL